MFRITGANSSDINGTSTNGTGNNTTATDATGTDATGTNATGTYDQGDNYTNMYCPPARPLRPLYSDGNFQYTENSKELNISKDEQDHFNKVILDISFARNGIHQYVYECHLHNTLFYTPRPLLDGRFCERVCVQTAAVYVPTCSTTSNENTGNYSSGNYYRATDTRHGK